MASIVFNIALGKVCEYHDRVVRNDPASSALVLIPIETSGLQSDAVLRDLNTVAAVLAGTTNEQTTMGRKVLTDADLLGLPAPDDTNDRNQRSLPSVTWANASGNAISKILVAYDPDTTGGTDADLVPLTLFDAVATPDGNDLPMTGGVFFRAQ